MSPKKRYLFALSSALLLFLSWPPLPLSPLLLVGLVPLFLALMDVVKSDEPKKGKTIFRLSFFTFFVFNTLSVYWIYNAISAYNTGISGVVTSLLVSLIPYALGPLLCAGAIWLAYRVTLTRNFYIKALAFISFFLSAEYLQQSWDLAFPWMTLGNGFSSLHQLIQWYEYTGVYGGTTWILLSNLFLVATIRYFQLANKRSAILFASSSAAIIFVPMAYSLYVYSSFEEDINPSNVVIAQPNIDPYDKYGSLTALDQLNVLTSLSETVAKPNTEYFIWPETAVPNYADEDQIRTNREFLQAQSFLAKYANGTLISGIETIKWYPNEATQSSQFIASENKYLDHFNSAIQIENSASVELYHKSKLVPGVEKLPFPGLLGFLKPVFAKLGGSVSGWGWQENPTVFYSQSGIGTVPVICFESLWGNWIGRSVKEGAQFITIITNDGWWGNTSGKDQHLQYAKLRAIEMRRYVARSANTGISAAINQKGDIVSKTSWWTREALNVDIHLNSNLTFYAKNGDIIPIAAALFSLILAGIYLVGRTPLFRSK